MKTAAQKKLANLEFNRNKALQKLNKWDDFRERRAALFKVYIASLRRHSVLAFVKSRLVFLRNYRLIYNKFNERCQEITMKNIKNSCCFRI